MSLPKEYGLARGWPSAPGQIQLSLAIGGTPVASGVQGSPYAGFSVTVAGGVAPYGVQVASGALPPGLTLAATVYPNVWIVTGTPTFTGNFPNIVLRATDSVGGIADLAPFTITVSAAVTLAAIGTQVTAWGDGTMGGGAIGPRSAVYWFLAYFNGRMMPSPGFFQCKSGGDMDTLYARINQALMQKAGVPLFTSQGHNDALMTTDPDVNPIPINKWIRNATAWWNGNPLRTAGGLADFIPFCSTLPSQVGGENATIWNKVWAIQHATVSGFGAGSVYLPTGENTNITTFYTAGDTAHPNTFGGKTLGFNIMGPSCDAYVTSATQAAIEAMMVAGSYPGLTNANLDVNTPLTGTGGTKAGSTLPTGNVANTKTVTNSTTSAVACDNAAGAGPQQVVTITGAASVENTVVFTGANAAITGATPGGYTVAAGRVIADDGAGNDPVGLVTLGLDVGGGTYGVFMTSGPVAGTGGNMPKFDSFIIIPPNALGAASTFSQAARWTPRRAITVTGALRWAVESTTIRLASNRTRNAPGYFGDNTILAGSQVTRLVVSSTLATSNPTNRVSVDCATTANIALTGEQTVDGFATAGSRVWVKNQTTTSQNGIYVSAAGAWTRSSDYNTQALIQANSVLVTSGSTQAGQLWICTTTGVITVGTTLLVMVRYTLRQDPGSFVPYGLLETDFTRRIYLGGSAAIGSGVKVADLTGSAWTWIVDPVLVPGGGALWGETDANNGVGATATARTPIAILSA